MSAERRFAIGGDLLAGPHGDGRWNNLGYLEDDYSAACRALACLHAEAVGLGPRDHLLEMACGYGAALAVWRDAYAVADLTALELRGDCVEVVRRDFPALAAQVFQGRFDRPLPKSMPRDHDALICVDAAYHAESLKGFLDCAASALKPGGRLAFSTLVRESDVPPRGMSGWLLKGAGIPAASQLSRWQLETQLSASGFRVTGITDLSEPVLAGFPRRVAQRRRHIPLARRLSRDWLKIEVTARLCHSLWAGERWRYILVAGEKSTELARF